MVQKMKVANNNLSYQFDFELIRKGDVSQINALHNYLKGLQDYCISLQNEKIEYLNTQLSLHEETEKTSNRILKAVK